MFLEQYLERFQSNPLMPDPAAIDLGGTLATGMMQVRDKAETAGVEHGCNLYYLAGNFELGAPHTGTQVSVSLDTVRESANRAFVGDFHVHPYSRKMSSEVSIGFSTDDIEGYLAITTRYSLKFYFVAAGNKLWLIIIYPWTQAQGAGPVPTVFDVAKGQSFMSDEKARYAAWTNMINQRNSAVGTDAKIAIERNLWDSIPEFPAVFATANLTMNHQLANHHRYGLYIGKFDTAANGLRLMRH
jgi:hypothetical protein